MPTGRSRLTVHVAYRLPPELIAAVDAAFPARTHSASQRMALDTAILALQSAQRRLTSDGTHPDYIQPAEWSLLRHVMPGLTLTPAEWHTLPFHLATLLSPIDHPRDELLKALNKLDAIELGWVYLTAKGANR